MVDRGFDQSKGVSRRTFLRVAGIGAAAIFVSGCGQGESSPEATPNVSPPATPDNRTTEEKQAQEKAEAIKKAMGDRLKAWAHPQVAARNNWAFGIDRKTWDIFILRHPVRKIEPGVDGIVETDFPDQTHLSLSRNSWNWGEVQAVDYDTFILQRDSRTNRVSFWVGSFREKSGLRMARLYSTGGRVSEEFKGWAYDEKGVALYTSDLDKNPLARATVSGLEIFKNFSYPGPVLPSSIQ